MANIEKVAGVISDTDTSGISDIIAQILPRGHVIHGYSSARSNRMLMVLESEQYTDDAPLLGFGVDGFAEGALARALITYGIREKNQADYITEKELPESTEGALPPGLNNSVFDNIVWGGSFKMFQKKGAVTAWSQFGGGNGLMPITTVGKTPLEALDGLAEEFKANNPVVADLANLALQYIPYQ